MKDNEIIEMLHDAMGLLMNNEQHEDDQWKNEYNKLCEKYVDYVGVACGGNK